MYRYVPQLLIFFFASCIGYCTTHDMSKVQGFVIVVCLIIAFFVVTYRDSTKKREWVVSKPPITIFEIHEPPPLIVDLSPEYSAYLKHENMVFSQLVAKAKKRAELAEKEIQEELIEQKKNNNFASSNSDNEKQITAVWVISAVNTDGYEEKNGFFEKELLKK